MAIATRSSRSTERGGRRGKGFAANSVGRLTALSPVTWKDGWPYFGLPGNLGRSPRIWVKPRTGVTDAPMAPYRRSDDFSGTSLLPIWQWNLRWEWRVVEPRDR